LNLIYSLSAFYVLLEGAPERLSNGNDFRAEICGTGKYSNRTYQYFANAIIDVSVSFCVKECPSSTGQTICLYDTKGIDYPNDDPYYAKFCYVQLRSDPLGKYCIPKEPINRSKVDVFLN
jgi:hypothetical protein